MNSASEHIHKFKDTSTMKGPRPLTIVIKLGLCSFFLELAFLRGANIILILQGLRQFAMKKLMSHFSPIFLSLSRPPAVSGEKATELSLSHLELLELV